jgi:hypothetical protein
MTGPLLLLTDTTFVRSHAFFLSLSRCHDASSQIFLPWPLTPSTNSPSATSAWLNPPPRTVTLNHPSSLLFTVFMVSAEKVIKAFRLWSITSGVASFPKLTMAICVFLTLS